MPSPVGWRPSLLCRLEANAIAGILVVGLRPSLLGWRPLLVGWRPSLVGWRTSLGGSRPWPVGWGPWRVGWGPSPVGWRTSLLGWRPLLVEWRSSVLSGLPLLWWNRFRSQDPTSCLKPPHCQAGLMHPSGRGENSITPLDCAKRKCKSRCLHLDWVVFCHLGDYDADFAHSFGILTSICVTLLCHCIGKVG